jgi:hypothetical protein
VLSAEFDEASRTEQDRLLDQHARFAAGVFVAVLVVASALYLFAGRDKWFFFDEWDYLAGRHLTSIDDLLRPHNEHWSTIPIVVWRLVWSVVGLRAYWPYQLLAVANGLALAALLRVVMRRAGVGPWIATVVASVFVLFGAGNEDLINAFQVQFTGAVSLGVAHLLLADHEGGLDRRDWLGLFAGLAAVMTTSGVGVVMVGVVAVATLIRRGWRLAAFHSVPLAAIYTVWWLAYGRDGDLGPRAQASTVAKFVETGYQETFVALGWLRLLGALLVVVMVSGLVLAWRHLSDRDVRWAAAGPLSMLLGGLVFLAIAGWTRGVWGSDYAKASRYLHLTAAFTLPALAVALEALYRRWQPMGLAALTVLLIGVPASVRRTVDFAKDNPLALGRRELVLSLAHSPLLDDAPADLRPIPAEGPEVTAGWLRDSAAQGKIPNPASPPSESTQGIIELLLGLDQVDRPASAPCVPVGAAEERVLHSGDVVDFDTLLQVTSLDQEARDAVATFTSVGPSRLVVVGDRTLHVRLTPVAPGGLCR